MMMSLMTEVVLIGQPLLLSGLMESRIAKGDIH